MAGGDAVRVGGLPPNPQPVDVALNPPNGTVANSVATPPVRVIYWAQGLDMHPGDHYFTYDFPDVIMDPDRARYQNTSPAGLASLRRLELTPNSPTAMVHQYTDPTSNVTFELRRTFDKAVFRDWLRDPEAFVVYAGHCRYGRGPCFSLNRTDHGEDFQNGTDPAHAGLFRMGFDFIAVPAFELLEYAYNADLWFYEGTGAPTARTIVPGFDPSLFPPSQRRYLGQLHYVSVEAACREARELPNEVNLPWHLQPVHPSLRGRYALGYRAPYQGSMQWHLIHRAGWRSTNMEEVGMDLGSSPPRCRLFTFIGCKSSPLIGPIFRDPQRLNWQETDDHQIAWFLSETGYIFIGYYFFYHLVTAPQSVLAGTWHDWSTYAKDRANETARLDRVAQHYQLECPGGCTP